MADEKDDPRKDFFYNPGSGGSVRIILSKRKGLAEGPQSGGLAEDESGVGPSSFEDDEAIPLRKPTVRFFDLHTRLRSVPPQTFTAARARNIDETEAPVREDTHFNEYVELQDSARHLEALLGSRVEGPHYSGPPPDFIEYFDTLDPLGFSEANVTGRQIPNCMPIPYDARGYKFHFRANDETFTLGPNEHERWKSRLAAPEDADEKWNPHNLLAGVAHTQGTLKLKAKPKSLEVLWPTELGKKIQGIYLSFKTDDVANFKCTEGPSYDSAPVEIAFTRKPLRVYLVPRPTFFSYLLYIGASEFEDIGPVWVSRVMVYPNAFPNLLTVLGQNSIEYRRLWQCFLDRETIPAEAQTEYPPNPPPARLYYRARDERRGNDLMAHNAAGNLTAVIVQGVKVYYVWRKTPQLVNWAAEVNVFPSGYVTLDAECE